SALAFNLCCFLYCVPGRLASGLSSGPGASGSKWGKGGWLHLLGDLLQGVPLWPSSVFMSIFKGTTRCREREERIVKRRQRCCCYFPKCFQQALLV
uniref:Secreted protein n=1 Tax=Poecilia mexicana TaxID=48701 RepID=A0A3B3XLV2_9TELE